MSKARAYLHSALTRVADGGDITTAELNAAIPDPSALDEPEKAAWEELSHWADDADIRAKDPHYATFKRAWMRDHIAAMNGYLPVEIERGEHQAQHVPIWGCVTAALFVAGAAYLVLT